MTALSYSGNKYDDNYLPWRLKVKRIKGAITKPYEWRLRYVGKLYQGRADSEQEAQEIALDTRCRHDFTELTLEPYAHTQ